MCCSTARWTRSTSSLGFGLDYLKQHNHSTFTAEVHVRYVRELHENDPVRVTFQLLDYDLKRVHYFEQLFHATEGWVSATSENMTLHVDMAAKKVAPFPAKIMGALARMKAAHAKLPRPEAVGRRIAMPGKGLSGIVYSVRARELSGDPA